MDPVERLALATREARFGEHGGVNPSIEVSTTFTVLDAKTLPDIFNGFRGPDPKQGGCYLYGRSYSPTVQQLGRQLAAMEDTEAAYPVASGMAAISCAVLGLCSSGDHIVCSNCVYGGTFAFMKTYLPAKCGISVSFVDITDTGAVAAAVTAKTKVVYCETVSNPTLVVADLPELARITHTGASDIIAGVVCGRASFVASLMDLHMGSLEQRLAQLCESYSFVASTNGVPPYKATKVRVCPDGTVQELMSWPSWGPQEDETQPEEPTAAGGNDDALGAMATDTLAAAAVTAAATAAATAATAAGAGSPVAEQQHNPPQGLLPLTRSGSPPSPRVGSTPLGGGKAAAALAAAVGMAAAAGSSAGGASSNTGAAALCAEPWLGGDEATGGRGLSRLRPVASASSDRPVKIRRVDDDTHVVYTPTPPPAVTAV